MNPLVATGLFSGAGAAALAYGLGPLSPEPALWWTSARDLLRAQYGIASVRGQTLDSLRASLQRRSVNAHGESDKYSGYPATDTQENLLELCNRWLSAFPLWLATLVDAKAPDVYLAVRTRRDIHQGAVNLGLDSTPALEDKLVTDTAGSIVAADATFLVGYDLFGNRASGDTGDTTIILRFTGASAEQIYTNRVALAAALHV